MLLKQGIANRITSATTMNAHSSRSHAIFTVYLQVIYNDPLGHQHIRKAKLNLVDLAGSERHGKTGISTNSGSAFTESKSINLSLSCLGKVIQALSQDKPGHVPYRESKLTRLLQVNSDAIKLSYVYIYLTPQILLKGFSGRKCSDHDDSLHLRSRHQLWGDFEHLEICSHD